MFIVPVASGQAPGWGTGTVIGYISLFGTGALPVCLGVAVLKYRLYDLDRIIGRVVSYALITAALFNPLRRRVQRAVDRRFNRSRYDADAVVAAFSGRLRHTVDLDAVRNDLVGVVSEAFQPTAVSMWFAPGPWTDPPAGPAAVSSVTSRSGG